MGGTHFACIFAGTMVASSMMDKQGRRKLLMGSFTGMVCCKSLFSLAVSSRRVRFRYGICVEYMISRLYMDF